MRTARTRRVVFAITFAALFGAAMLTGGQEQPRSSPPPPLANAPTFTKDVAPILYANCVGCHRPGEIGPMPLISYANVRPWAKSIRDNVAAGVMPPWFADPAHGRFRNDRRLSKKDIDTVVAWVNAGARQGSPAELPPLPTYADGWQIGTPDIVFEMPVEYEVPLDGTIAYQYFEVPTNFAEDRWVQAAEVRIGDREHVHHSIVFYEEPGDDDRPTAMQVRPIPAEGQTLPERFQRQGAARTSRRHILVNFAVGEDAPVYPAGVAKRLKAGSKLVFQMHYTTNGAPGRDRSKVGLIFAKTPPARELRTGSVGNPVFAIPPGAPSHPVEAEATFVEDTKIWTLHPHMHLRGKDMLYRLQYPDGRSEILLNVPRFDFGWQSDYWLAEPISAPKGSTLRVTAHFDNSTGNPNNPDPKATVRWGDQTWEEMMIGFLTYTVESRPAATTAGDRR